ncbi:hypothetical protein GQ55_1G308600 [Panicum hallii var. hallii]|uniref:Uncharacterized protein n=1 Tax=Panicum hallii var. hallii TaxID=1504633 RepID=A0A2T7F9A0_9POAL|nr:hypothetical protein GQ55_1G308600 [Panicum hallii var. hallii]
MRAHARAAPAVTPEQRGRRRRPLSWRRGGMGRALAGFARRSCGRPRGSQHMHGACSRECLNQGVPTDCEPLTAARRQGHPPPVLNIYIIIIRSARQRSHRLRWVRQRAAHSAGGWAGWGMAMEGLAAKSTACGRGHVWRRRFRPRQRCGGRPQSWAPLGGDEAPAAKIFLCTLPCVMVYKVRTKPSGGVAAAGGGAADATIHWQAASSMLDLLVAGMALPADFFFFIWLGVFLFKPCYTLVQ